LWPKLEQFFRKVMQWPFFVPGKIWVEIHGSMKKKRMGTKGMFYN
jgi:hypothetical protein